MSLDDRAERQMVSSTQSIFSLGPILGGLALIVAISLGAWIYQQKTQTELSIRNIEARINGLEQLFGAELGKIGQQIKKNNDITTSRFRTMNIAVGKVQQLVSYFDNYLDDQLADIRESLPDAPKPARKRTVGLPKPMKPTMAERDEPKSTRRPQRPGKTKPVETILDLDENEDQDDPEELLDEIDRFNN